MGLKLSCCPQGLGWYRAIARFQPSFLYLYSLKRETGVESKYYIYLVAYWLTLEERLHIFWEDCFLAFESWFLGRWEKRITCSHLRQVLDLEVIPPPPQHLNLADKTAGLSWSLHTSSGKHIVGQTIINLFTDLTAMFFFRSSSFFFSAIFFSRILFSMFASSSLGKENELKKFTRHLRVTS